jgi:predicted RND superfamily exporter protein
MEALFEYSERFGGGGNFNAFLVETAPGGLEDPTVINAIYDMQIKMRTTGASVSSIADTLKEINDILDRNIIIEKFANLTDADNIIFDKIAKQGIVNKDHSKTLILVSIPVGKSVSEIEELVIQLNDIALTTNLPQNGQISELTGQDAVYVAVNAKLFDEQTSSLMISLILVLAVLILLFKSSVYGFLTIIPVCFVIMWEPGFLVATGISLSPITIVIASIMIGIGIDYGVHITYRVREEISKGYSKMDAAKIAIEKTGLSLMEAALTTTFGMSSIFFLGIASLSEFVIVIIFMVGVSYIAAALLLPMFYDNRFIK